MREQQDIHDPTQSAAQPSAEQDPNCEDPGSKRDPEERPADDQEGLREKMLDKTLADSFPTSDPPSTIPDPAEDDSFAA